jgi:arylsulfatase A-like enzyme
MPLSALSALVVKFNAIKTCQMKAIATYILTALTFLSFSCQKEEVKQAPNIVFILADDLGAHDLSVTGSTYYETPNIDRIAQEGFVFTQGYAASRVCSPSRASLMTGKFTARHGVTDWIGARSGTKWREHNRHDLLLPADYTHSLAKADISLAEAMQQAGYATFFAGKWHLGSEGDHPEDHGFDINKGGWDKGSPMGGYFSPWNNPSLPNQTPGENLSMRLAKETANFIKANKDSSFFAYLSFYAVHGPIQTTQEKWQKYQEKALKAGITEQGFEMERVLPIRKTQDNPIYAGLLEGMDDAVGLILQTLEELGLAENTIIVFTSDNGGVASGDSFSTSNLPLRGGKGYQWEGGIREPYFIKVPWMNGQGKAINEPVIGTDFYPTLLDLAGLDLLPEQHLDGQSLKPLLEGGSLAERPLYWHYPHYGNQGGDPSSIIRLGNWKLIHYWEDGHEELYDLSKDPQEQQDIATQNPDKTQELNKKLMAWLNEVKANYPAEDSLYDATLRQALLDRNRTVRWPNLEKSRLQFLAPDFKPNPTWWDSKVTKD